MTIHSPMSQTWPCSYYVEDWWSCPGYGTAHTCCMACHRLYRGYVALCPIHTAAPALLLACQDASSALQDRWHGTGLEAGDRDLWKKLDAAIAQAMGQMTKGKLSWASTEPLSMCVCGEPEAHHYDLGSHRPCLRSGCDCDDYRAAQ